MASGTLLPPMLRALRERVPPEYRAYVKQALYRRLHASQLYVKWVAGRSRTEIHDYWRRPWDSANRPELYLNGDERSAYLLGLLQMQGIAKDAHILELGCNVGRNLNHLHSNGFTRLAGIEISADALTLMKSVYPELAGHADIRNNSIEDELRAMEPDRYDVVYSMAVLEHIHRDSDWIFAEIARVTRGWLITIEDERGQSWRHFPRRYDEVFSRLGLEVVHRAPVTGVKGLNQNFFTTVFRRKAAGSPA